VKSIENLFDALKTTQAKQTTNYLEDAPRRSESESLNSFIIKEKVCQDKIDEISDKIVEEICDIDRGPLMLKNHGKTDYTSKPPRIPDLELDFKNTNHKKIQILGKHKRRLSKS